MADSIHRFLFEDLDIRGALVQLGHAWRELSAPRAYPPTVTSLLGETAAVAALIAGNLKAEQRLAVQLQGRGAVSLLLMDCQPVRGGPLRLRGMARGDWPTGGPPGAVPPRLCFEPGANLTDLVGDGKLVLTLYPEEGEAYQSLVPLAGGSVAEAFEHYLAQSEQQPAHLWLAADAHTACGLFLQRLPGADARDADGWNRVIHLAQTLRAEELLLPPAELLRRLFPEETLRLFAPRRVEWHCPRDEGKVLDMLRSLGREEIELMLEEASSIQIEDEICGQTYRFGPEIVAQLFQPPSRTLH